MKRKMSINNVLDDEYIYEMRKEEEVVIAEDKEEQERRVKNPEKYFYVGMDEQFRKTYKKEDGRS